MSRILVTDLDGTLLGGGTGERRRLRDALARHRGVSVVFATGRGPASVRQVLRDALVPRPRWVIADVGATVLDGTALSAVEPLQERLRAGWPGPERVRAALARFPALTYQHAVAQEGRCSYYLAPNDLTPELTASVEALGCRWEYSAGRYFDVLPPRASKGGALRALAQQMAWPVRSILVAGDSLNDLSLFRLGAHGVIVGGAEPALSTAVGHDPLVHRPSQAGAGGILAALHTLGWVTPPRRPRRRGHALVVGYHRPPAHRSNAGTRTPASPNGILPTLTSAFADGLPGIWVAATTPGTGPAPRTHPAEAPPSAPPAGEEAPAARRDGPPLSLVPLSAHQWSGYFHQACKELLWPVLMSEPHRMVFRERSWAAYRAVNARFARHIADRAAPGATVWLHDYNLWLVPGILRTLRPDLRLGLFHHTPFPPARTFAALPVAAQLRASLAQLDWAGFHTAAFADHFRKTLGNARPLPRIGVHPLGIDRPAIEAIVRTRPRTAPPPAHRLVLSVERLDYAKAPVQKVDALERLLTNRPDLRGQVTFRLICPPPEPGITAYDTTRALLEQRVRQVNTTWSHDGWQPVDYRPTQLSFPDVVDQYLAADVLWITSLQDGMNLTAKEFVAAQTAQTAPNGPGVLVLSRHTGAAAAFGDTALLTDPHSPEDLTDTLARALDTPTTERQSRLNRLSHLLGHERPVDWARQVVDTIRQPPDNPDSHGRPDRIRRGPVRPAARRA
ncbi:trehalose-6-phosphate synthase [Kitasatospora cineracea]|uniref:trehalose-6-phosphate synthase n=1 Tax=Kitasatospora cineracea TaxID=88074 RepID=UPI0037FFF71F